MFALQPASSAASLPPLSAGTASPPPYASPSRLRRRPHCASPRWQHDVEGGTSSWTEGRDGESAREGGRACKRYPLQAVTARQVCRATRGFFQRKCVVGVYTLGRAYLTRPPVSLGFALSLSRVCIHTVFMFCVDSVFRPPVGPVGPSGTRRRFTPPAVPLEFKEEVDSARLAAAHPPHSKRRSIRTGRRRRIPPSRSMDFVGGHFSPDLGKRLPPRSLSPLPPAYSLMSKAS